MASPFIAAIRGMNDWISGPASLLDELARVKSGSRVAARIADDLSALEIEPTNSRKRSAALSFPISPDLQAPAGLRTLVNGKTVYLEVPANWIIARRIELPLEAASHVEGIVTSRIGALSPLPASEIYFGYKARGVSRETRQITVSVAIVQRSRVAAALTCLNLAETRQVVISALCREGDVVEVLTQRQRAAGARTRIKFVLAGVLGASLVAAVTALAVRPIIQTSYGERRTALDIRAEKARQIIAQAAAPDKADTAPEQEALNIKDDAISALGALDDLAGALPKHSYAVEVSFANGRMRLSGRTMDVPEVLTALESSGRFEDSKLVGAALRVEDSVTSEFEVETRPLIRTGGSLK
ncbi:PilN domain-containing protein [Rhizobium terrae]|uniref:PilN domain-containing protein n=1 Tax=Rhizobium terrae TaxID=2171756 RepID=UPI000E3DF0C7|nr:PilN domain-containing protein [Rhizobium terrae]